LKQARIARKVARREFDVAKSDYLPKVFLKAYAQRNIGNGEYKDLWNISVNVNYNLFDFGKEKRKIGACKGSR